MNNNMNNGSQTWIDPITGESYPSGNPHADIKSSPVVGSAPAQAPQYSAGVYNDPLPPGAVPQPVQRVQQMPQMPQMQQMQQMPQVQPMQPIQQERPVYQAAGITKFCEHCGSVLVQAAVICPTCGCQVAPIRQQVPEQMPVQHNPAVPPYAGQQIQVQQVQQVQPIQPVQVIVNNVVNQGTPKDKIVSLLLCIFLGIYGVHRFYEGRIGTGILWLFTFGMFGIGWLYDVIRIASASNPYYIK